MVIQKFSIVAYNNHSRIVFLEKQIANKWDSLIQRELCDITDGLPVIKHIGYKNTTSVVIPMSSWSTESKMTEVACHTAYFARDRYVLCIARGGEKISSWLCYWLASFDKCSNINLSMDFICSRYTDLRTPRWLTTSDFVYVTQKNIQTGCMLTSCWLYQSLKKTTQELSVTG